MTALERARELVAGFERHIEDPYGTASPILVELYSLIAIAAAGLATRDMAIVNGMYAMSAHDVAELFDARIAAALGGDA